MNASLKNFKMLDLRKKDPTIFRKHDNGGASGRSKEEEDSGELGPHPVA
jgi:hypothetical protein